MKTFSNYISERFVNVFKPNEKQPHAQEVFDMIQTSYASIGGMKGSGFNSPEDMIAKIPFWKLVRKDNKIVAGSMYKDKSGRKRVAVFTNGETNGKAGLAMIMKEDFARAYFEVSKASLGFMVKTLGVSFVKKYAKTLDQVADRLDDDVELLPVPKDDLHLSKFPELKDFFYQRELGGTNHTKIMLGK
jgi:hypothetical protein